MHFFHYTIGDSSGHADLIDWDGNLNFSRGDVLTILFANSKYYAPRNSHSITVSPNSIVTAVPAESSEAIFQAVSLHSLFSDTYEGGHENTPNFIESIGMAISINAVTQEKSPDKNGWRVALNFDDNTGVIKLFTPLENLLNVLPEGFLSENKTGVSIKRGLERHLCLRRFQVCGRINRYQPDDSRIYLSMFVEEPFQPSNKFNVNRI